MENEDIFDWKRGRYFLPRIGVQIDIHPSARVLNLEGDLPAYTPFDQRIDLDTVLGLFVPIPVFGRNDGINFQFVIGHIPALDDFSATFIQGHEEGHLLSYLGQLETLRKEAECFGYRFDFLSPEFCQERDACAKRIISLRHSAVDYQKIWKQERVIAESIANVGGLVSLVKGGASDTEKKKIEKAIVNMETHPLDQFEEKYF